MNITTTVQAPAPRAIPIARASSHVALGRRRRMLTRAVQSDRARVLATFRSAMNGVDAHAAAVRTNAFYRSSGFAWARCLG